MTRKPTTVDEEIQIYFYFGLCGWSDLLFVRNGQVTPFRISHVFTPAPDSLLDICQAVLKNTSLRVALCDEPGGVVLEVKRDEKQHTMIVSVFEITSPLGGFEASEEGNLVISVRLKRQRLIGMLLSELWKTHKFLSEPSYQKSRGDFPHARLMATNKEWADSALGPSFLA